MPSLLDQLTKQAENPLASSPTQPTPPVTFRDFGDANATRKLIFDNVLSAARKMPTVGNNRYQLSLHDVDYEDPDHISIKDQKSMMLRGETAHRRLRGTWKLHDALGNEIETRRMTLAQVPYMTQAGTFILNGTQNSLKHQMRLDPGAYTRIKETGSAETHANIRPGKGLSHRYNLEPSTGVFRMDFAQSSLPLVPILKAFGATDSELRGQWGNELFEANMRKDDPRVISKLYKRLVARGTAEDPEDKAKAVVEALQKMEFDPEVNRRTLGHPYANISKDAIFAISKKLLAVSRGEAEPDDRDHLAYQHVMGPEDLLAERLSRPGPLLHQLLWKASTKGSLKSMPVGAFDRHLRGAIQDSGLGLNDESVNPVEWLDQQHAITRLGKGGISSSEAVPDEARNVLPSHVGYIDLSKVPESSAAGVEGRIAYSVRKGSDGRLYAPYINAKTGKTEYKNPKDVTGMVLAFPGEMENKSPLAYALVDGRAKRVPKSKVELVLPHGEQWFSPASNMVALKHSSKGQRGSMGARFITQALPLTAPEAPLVQSAIPGSGGKSFDSLFGKDVGAVYAAKQGGRVKSVTPDEIVVKYNDGTTQTHELYNNFVNNRKTGLSNTPLVREGDPVLPGQLIAKSNYTDNNGTIALGLNMRTAYITWPSNFEDAIVISEEAAKKLSSEHLYQHKLDFDPGQRRAKKDYVSIFANKYDKKTLANIDDHGFIKPGSVVKHGDPLILVAGERPLSHKTVHASHRGAYADRTLTWDHEEDGVVTDVAVTGKGATVVVKTIMPMRIGDKLCFDPETDVLTEKGWKRVADVTTEDRVATLNPDGDWLEWQNPTHTWEFDHDGKMYELVMQQVDMLVTPEHRIWAAKAEGKGAGEYVAITAQELFESRSPWKFKKDCNWRGREQLSHEFTRVMDYNSRVRQLQSVDMDIWLEFLGYYIAEGWCHTPKSGGGYVRIAQFRKSKGWDGIKDVLTRLGLPFRYNEADKRFELGNVWLHDYLKPLGDSHTKRIPSYIQELPPRQLWIFLKAYLLGDGHLKKRSDRPHVDLTGWESGSASEGLMYDIQLLCLKLGACVNVRAAFGVKPDGTVKEYWRGRVNTKFLRPCRKKSKLGLYKSNHEGMVDYKGKVYCITVPNHIIYVKRRDKSYWSLNSGRYG